MARIFGYTTASARAANASNVMFGQLAPELKRLSGFDGNCTFDVWEAPHGGAGIMYVSKPGEGIQVEDIQDASILVLIEGAPYDRDRRVETASIGSAYLSGNLESFVNELNGAFAIVILDYGNKKAVICQDRFGSKTFFYSHNKDVLYFGSFSSLLSIARHGARVPNVAQVARFASVHYSHIYGMGETFYDDVWLTQAATIAVWEAGKLASKEYWRFDPQAPFLDGVSEQELGAMYEEKLLTSLESRLAPMDDKLIFSLSGGMDSSTLLGYYNKITGKKPEAVSVTYHEDVRANEYKLIKPTADAYTSVWHNIQPTADEFFQDFSSIYDHYDHPWPTATLYAQDRMFRAASQAGYKYMMGGSGGDHHMAGDYPNFLHYFAVLREQGNEDMLKKEVEHWIEYHSEPPWMKSWETVNTFFDQFIDFSERGKLKNGPVDLSPNMEILTSDYRSNLRMLPPVPSFGDYMRSYVVKEITRAAYLPALSCEDIIGWRCGVSEITPYWDKELFEFSWRVPHNMKIRNGINKYLMREVVDGVVLDHIRLRKAKTGFNMPFDVWVKDDRYLDMINEVLRSAQFESRGVYRPEAVKKIIDDHVSGRAGHGMLIWQMLNLELWFRNWIDQPVNLK